MKIDYETFWREEAKEFSGHYNRRYFNIKRATSLFLDKRTKIINSFLFGVRGDELLDAGCGSGVHMKIAIPRFKRVVGLDVSSDMLDEAKIRLSKFGSKNYGLYLADANNKFPFESRRFDIVLSIGLLDYVNAEHVLSECTRVLKDNGLIIFTIPKKPSIFFFLRYKNISYIRKKLLGLPPIKNAVNKKGLNDLMMKCGLKPLNIESVWSTMWIVKAKRRKT